MSIANPFSISDVYVMKSEKQLYFKMKSKKPLTQALAQASINSLKNQIIDDFKLKDIESLLSLSVSCYFTTKNIKDRKLGSWKSLGIQGLHEKIDIQKFYDDHYQNQDVKPPDRFILKFAFFIYKKF